MSCYVIHFRGDWASAARIASHMLVSPLVLSTPPRRKPEKEPFLHNPKRYTASSLLKDEKNKNINITADTPPSTSASTSIVFNCLKDSPTVTDFSRDHYLKLPKYFQNRIFAIRETQTRNAAVAVTVTAAAAAVSVEDSHDVSNSRKIVDSGYSSKDNNTH